MKRIVKADTLRRLVHHNLYAHGKNKYEDENAIACAEAMAANGWGLPVWLTQNQVDNPTGKYAWHGLRVLPGEEPQVTIVKVNAAYDPAAGQDPDAEPALQYVYTPVYNIDQTNFAVVAPGAYDLLCQGKTFEEVSDILMHQPLMTRAMQTGKQTPSGFFNRIMARASCV